MSIETWLLSTIVLVLSVLSLLNWFATSWLIRRLREVRAERDVLRAALGVPTWVPGADGGVSIEIKPAACAASASQGFAAQSPQGDPPT